MEYTYDNLKDFHKDPVNYPSERLLTDVYPNTDPEVLHQFANNYPATASRINNFFNSSASNQTSPTVDETTTTLANGTNQGEQGTAGNIDNKIQANGSEWDIDFNNPISEEEFNDDISRWGTDLDENPVQTVTEGEQETSSGVDIETGSNTNQSVNGTNDSNSDYKTFMISPEKQEELLKQVEKEAGEITEEEAPAQNDKNESGENLYPSKSNEYISEPPKFDENENIEGETTTTSPTTILVTDTDGNSVHGSAETATSAQNNDNVSGIENTSKNPQNTAQSVYMRSDGTVEKIKGGVVGEFKQSGTHGLYDSTEATTLLQKTNDLNKNLDEIWKFKDNTIKVVNGNLNPKTRQKINVASLFDTVSSNINSWRNGLVVITTSLTNGINAMNNVDNAGSGVDNNLDSTLGLGKTTGVVGTSKQGSNGYINVSNDINNGTGTIINNKNKLSGIGTISVYNLSKKQNDITKTIDKKTPSINIIDKKENKPEEPINKNLITSSLGKITFNKVVDLKESLNGSSSAKCDLNVSYGLLGINKQNDEYYYMIIDQKTGKLYYVPINSDFNIEVSIENVLQINDTTMLFNFPQTDVNQGNYAGLIQKDNLFFIKEQVTNNGVDFVKILNPKDGKDYYVALSDTNEVIKLESITGVNESI